MLILAFDTSGPRLACALAEDEEILAADVYEDEGRHMARLLPALQDILKRGGRELGEVGCFAAGVGPGSFTGIRIGAATAQALAFAREVPCIALNSLDAAAYDKHAENTLTAAMYEARNRRIYAAAYRGGAYVIPPAVGPADDFAAVLKAKRREGEKLLFCGDETAARYAADEKIREILGRQPEASDELGYRPEVLGKMAWQAWQEKKLLKPHELLPEYYAATQAERRFGFAPDAESFG